MRHLVLYLLVFTTYSLVAQVQLGPCLTNGQMPADADSIQPYTAYIDTTNTFVSGGYQVGQTVNDFILYSRDSIAYQLSNMLNVGNKPVLLISGSYSCPAFRYCMNQVLPDIMSLYGTQLIYITIYQLEAHPVGPDYSPFADTVFVPGQNFSDGVVFRQPRTYGERKYRAFQSDSSLGSWGIKVMDGPGNEYWTALGPSPNNAYLITKTGWVFGKYGWLGSEEGQCISDISSLLATVGIFDPVRPSLVGGFENPVSGSTVITSQHHTPIQTRITNITGQEIYNGTLLPDQTFSPAEALPEDGFYILTLIADDRQQTFTLVRKQ